MAWINEALLRYCYLIYGCCSNSHRVTAFLSFFLIISKMMYYKDATMVVDSDGYCSDGDDAVASGTMMIAEFILEEE